MYFESVLLYISSKTLMIFSKSLMYKLTSLYFLYLFVNFKSLPVIALAGASTVTHEAKDSYSDDGASAEGRCRVGHGQYAAGCMFK